MCEYKEMNEFDFIIGVKKKLELKIRAASTGEERNFYTELNIALELLEQNYDKKKKYLNIKKKFISKEEIGRASCRERV